jgi:hypothetical protein
MERPDGNSGTRETLQICKFLLQEVFRHQHRLLQDLFLPQREQIIIRLQGPHIIFTTRQQSDLRANLTHLPLCQHPEMFFTLVVTAAIQPIHTIMVQQDGNNGTTIQIKFPPVQANGFHLTM